MADKANEAPRFLTLYRRGDGYWWFDVWSDKTGRQSCGPYADKSKANIELTERKRTVTVKIFSMNDCDYMAGETLEACKAEYIKSCGGDAWDDPDEDQFGDARELTPGDMQHYKFTDEYGDQRTFREQLDKMIAEGDEFPTFFASTEW